MSVYTYKASLGREDFAEEGTVLAKDEQEAKKKLNLLEFNDIRLRKITGLSAFVKKFTADVK